MLFKIFSEAETAEVSLTINDPILDLPKPKFPTKWALFSSSGVYLFKSGLMPFAAPSKRFWYDSQGCKVVMLPDKIENLSLTNLRICDIALASQILDEKI